MFENRIEEYERRCRGPPQFTYNFLLSPTRSSARLKIYYMWTDTLAQTSDLATIGNVRANFNVKVLPFVQFALPRKCEEPPQISYSK